MQTNTPVQFVSAHIYASNYLLHHTISHNLKDFDRSALYTAAYDMLPLIPPESVLIPIPSRTGLARDTLALAQEIVWLQSNLDFRNSHHGIEVMDVLRGNARTSQYAHKFNAGVSLPFSAFGTRVVSGVSIPEDRPIVLIDNVLATGVTAAAAVSALGGRGVVVVYAYDDRVASEAPLMKLPKEWWE